MNRFLYAKSLLMLVFTFCCGLELTRGQDIQSDSQNGASPIANSQEAQQSDSKVPVKPTKPKKKRADKFKPDKFLSYKKVEKGELRLHVFEPEGHQATDQAPAIVFFSAAVGMVGRHDIFISRPSSLQGMVLWPCQLNIV